MVEALVDVEDALAALLGEEPAAAGVSRDHALLDDLVGGPPGLDDDLLEGSVLVEYEVVVRAVLEEDGMVRAPLLAACGELPEKLKL